MKHERTVFDIDATIKSLNALKSKGFTECYITLGKIKKCNNNTYLTIIGVDSEDCAVMDTIIDIKSLTASDVV